MCLSLVLEPEDGRRLPSSVPWGSRPAGAHEETGRLHVSSTGADYYDCYWWFLTRRGIAYGSTRTTWKTSLTNSLLESPFSQKPVLSSTPLPFSPSGPCHWGSVYLSPCLGGGLLTQPSISGIHHSTWHIVQVLGKFVLNENMKGGRQSCS